MNLTGRACPKLKCSGLMEWRMKSEQRIYFLPELCISVKPNICEVCPKCGYEFFLYLHLYSNRIAEAQKLIMNNCYHEGEKILLDTLDFHYALDSVYLLALLYLRQENLGKADKWFREGYWLLDDWPFTDIPTRQDFLIDYGFFLGFKLERYNEAVKIFQEAIALYEKNYKAYYNLGNLSVRNENWERAKFYFKKALEINPNHEMSNLAIKNISKLVSD